MISTSILVELKVLLRGPKIFMTPPLKQFSLCSEYPPKKIFMDPPETKIFYDPPRAGPTLPTYAWS